MVDKAQSAGLHKVQFDGTNQNGHLLPSGIYFYSIETENFEQTRRFLLVK